MTNDTEILDGTNEGLHIYEVGFHIIPSITEEQAALEAAEIKAVVENHKGVVIHEDMPKLRPLSYEISKVTDSVKKTYDNAYFGFIKFEGTTDNTEAIKIDLDKKDKIIRFILIKTVKDNTLYGGKMARENGTRTIKKPTKEDKAGEPVSEAELDKTIDELVIE